MTSISGPEFRFVPSTSLNLFQDSTFGSISTRSSSKMSLLLSHQQQWWSCNRYLRASRLPMERISEKAMPFMPLTWQVSETIRNLCITERLVAQLPIFVFFCWLLEGTRDVQYGLGLCDAWGIHFNRGPTNQLSSWHHSRLVSNMTCDFFYNVNLISKMEGRWNFNN